MLGGVSTSSIHEYICSSICVCHKLFFLILSLKSATEWMAVVVLSLLCCVSAAESQASHGKQDVGIGYMSPLLVLGGPGILLAS